MDLYLGAALFLGVCVVLAITIGLTRAILETLGRVDELGWKMADQQRGLNDQQRQIDELKELVGGRRLSNLGIAMNEELTGLLVPALQAVERLRKARGFLLDEVDEIDSHTQLLKDRLGRMRNGDWHKEAPARRGDGRRG